MCFKESKNQQVVSEQVALLFLILWSLSWSLTPVVMEHGHSLVIPPYFDGNNYAYWKVRMKAFLKSIDERVWNSVEYWWEKPTTPVSEWQTSQKEATAFNSKAMNVIFNAIFMEEFKRISNVEVAHTAWNILQTVHEGTKAVKINKLK